MDEPKVVKEQEEGDEDSQQAEGRGRLQQVSLELVIEALEGEQEDTEQEDFGIEPDFFHWSPFHCRCYSIGGCVCQAVKARKARISNLSFPSPLGYGRTQCVFIEPFGLR